MKKLLTLSMICGTLSFTDPAVEAKQAYASITSEPQINVRIGPQRNRRWGRWNNRRVRVVITTRITRIGRHRYRETIRTTYWPNGRARTQVISRVRLFG